MSDAPSGSIQHAVDEAVRHFAEAASAEIKRWKAEIDDAMRVLGEVIKAQADDMTRSATLAVNTARQRDELQGMLVQAERERDEARETCQMQAIEIARLNTEYVPQSEQDAKEIARLSNILEQVKAGRDREVMDHNREIAKQQERVRVLETALRRVRSYYFIADDGGTGWHVCNGCGLYAATKEPFPHRSNCPTAVIDTALTPAPSTGLAALLGQMPEMPMPGGEPRTFLRTNGNSEVCANCERHIRNHYGGTEYRCDPQDETQATCATCGSATCEGTHMVPPQGLVDAHGHIFDKPQALTAVASAVQPEARDCPIGVVERINLLRADLAGANKCIADLNDGCVRLEAELAAAKDAIARLDEAERRHAALHAPLCAEIDRQQAAHAATTAKLGRAVAALSLRLEPTRFHHGKRMLDPCDCEFCIARNAILADAESKAAGEAWAELEAVYEAAKDDRKLHAMGRDRANSGERVDDAVAAVDARRGGGR